MSLGTPQADAPETSDLFARALALSEAERADLAHQLLLSLDAEGSGREPGYAEAWSSEIERRLRDLDEGRTKLLTREEFETQLRQSLAMARRS